MRLSSSLFPTAPDTDRFTGERAPELRRARRWDRLSYIVGELPKGIEAMVPHLQVPPEGRVLDYGCAELPYRHLFGPRVDFVGADLPGNPHATIQLDPDGSLPLGDGEFDAVLSTQVLEHVTSPELYLAESYRALRPGGRILLSTHGVMVYHPDPVDYWRWTCAGLERALSEAGFVVERFEGIMGIASMGLQIVQDSLWDYVPRRLRSALALLFQSLIRGVERVWSDEQRRLNACVFVVVARKP